MKKIAIWGSGKSGINTYNQIQKYKEFYEVVFFIDNNSEKWGTTIQNIRVIGIKDRSEIESVDYIIIASVFRGEILEQIKKENIPCRIVEEITQLPHVPYRNIVMEISGICNAKCNWCVTGLKNQKKEANTEGSEKFLGIDSFKNLYHKLKEKGILDQDTVIILYSWGEPMINPDFNLILEFLESKEQRYSFSTNASVVREMPDSMKLNYLQNVTISMPGFSQESYDRIHGFDFEKIVSNIKKMVQNFRSCDFKGEFIISYHIYQFSMEELEAAREFALNTGIRIDPYFPYFNGLSMAISYMENTMEYSRLKKAGQELILFYVEDYLKGRPDSYCCPQEHILTLDIHENINLCCAADEDCKEYIIGNINTINSVYELKELKRKKMESETCKVCQMHALDYWANNVRKPADIK